MMDRTDRDFRWLMRRISRRTLLYTEMVTAQAIARGERDRLLAFDPSEHPIALQIGGDDPELLAEAARVGEGFGYDEINLNVGCPSDRVQSGNFGACLMLDPPRVAAGVAAMRDAVRVPVTVKHRIGVDERDRYEDMLEFVDVVSQASSDRFSVHARKAWLQGLSPKQNREVPPLRYDEVHRLKRERPHLPVEINGGIKTGDAVAEQLEHVDAVMLGRVAWDRPWIFADFDRRFFGSTEAAPSRREVVEDFGRYAEARIAAGGRPVPVLRGLLNLFAGEPGTKRWKQAVNEICRDPREVTGRLLGALDDVERVREETALGRVNRALA